MPMGHKTVLVAGATGLVGYAALKHFTQAPDIDVIAVSRRRPPGVVVRHLALDLTNPAACREAAEALRDVTHLVYAALFELPGLVEGWRNDQQIATNDRMLRNLLGPLIFANPKLRHVTLLQGTKAYGVHVRPLAVPAREGRSEMREQPNFYWAQEDYLRAAQAGRDWTFTILRPVLIVGEAIGGAMNLIPALGAHAAVMRERGPIYRIPAGRSGSVKRSTPTCWREPSTGPGKRRRLAMRPSISPTAMSSAGPTSGLPSLRRSACDPARMNRFCCSHSGARTGTACGSDSGCCPLR